MKKLSKVILEKYKFYFGAYGGESSRNTFFGELNHDSSKLFYMVFLTLVIMLVYVADDLKMHPFPVLAVIIHLGYTPLSAGLIALRLTPRFKDRPAVLMMVLSAYLYIGTAILTATSGSQVTSYIGAFSVVLMIPIFTPFPLLFKVTGTLVALAIFFVLAAVSNGIDFSSPQVRYVVNDLVVASLMALLFSYSQNRLRYRGWKQQQKLKNTLKEIERQDNLLNIVNRISSTLLQSDVDSFERDLLHSMGLMAEAVDADRVYIWKNSVKNGKLYCTQLYEWSEGAEPQQNKDFTLDASYDDRLPGWEKTLSQGNCLNGIVRKLSANEQAILSPQGILSILVAPVFLQEQFWGFVGFDDCHRERVFSKNEELILRSANLIIANAIIRNNVTKDARATAAQLEAVVSNYPGIIWCVNSAGIITLFNGTYLKKLGLEPGLFSGNTLEHVRHNSRYLESIANIEKTFVGGGQEWISEIDGRVYHARTTPIYDERGQVTQIAGGFDDITELIRLQEELKVALKKAQDASMAKSDFLARMSHEIRTPMNAIIGMSELAMREDMSNTAREHNFTIKQAAANLLSIINDILDFSKIEKGNLEIVPKEYLLSSLIYDVIAIIRMRSFDSRLRFLVNVDSNIPNALIGDEIRIRQIILNLLSNAFKYTEKGSVSFEISGEITGVDLITLTIDVVDSGKGIKKEDIESLFDDFVQLDAEKNRGIEGTGLGLAITHNLVNAMGGKITVSSEYGKGSQFSVTLPQKICNSGKLARIEKPEEKRVLIYERREIYADSILRTMDNLGVQSTFVKTASDFYEEITGREYNFVFVAVNLYQNAKEIYPTLESNAKIVLIVEFGETVPAQKLTVLHTPLYSVPIANILNGISDKFSDSDNISEVRFTAPAAKVLVVDDINTNLIVAKGLLAPYQMQVDLCNSGREAIKVIQSRNYDLVFMDHRMPDMDGIETTLRIRAFGDKDQYYKTVPIIALTANAISGAQEIFQRNGFNDLLLKPIDTVRLNAVLDKWIPLEKRKGAADEKNETALAKEPVHPSARSNVDESSSPKANKRIEIKGIDVEEGISYTGGEIKYYIETLVEFYKDGLKKIQEIEMCLKNGDLHLYTIYVHALKGTAAIIGAKELSKTAKTLEMAGEKKDTEFIEAHNGEFLMSLESLLNDIKGEISSRSGIGNTGNVSFDMKQFESELVKLRTAIETLDVEVVNKTVNDLQKYAEMKDIGSVIESISEKILIAEYDDAVALIDTFREQQR